MVQQEVQKALRGFQDALKDQRPLDSQWEEAGAAGKKKRRPRGRGSRLETAPGDSPEETPSQQPADAAALQKANAQLKQQLASLQKANGELETRVTIPPAPADWKCQCGVQDNPATALSCRSCGKDKPPSSQQAAPSVQTAKAAEAEAADKLHQQKKDLEALLKSWEGKQVAEAAKEQLQQELKQVENSLHQAQPVQTRLRASARKAEKCAATLAEKDAALAKLKEDLLNLELEREEAYLALQEAEDTLKKVSAEVGEESGEQAADLPLPQLLNAVSRRMTEDAGDAKTRTKLVSFVAGMQKLLEDWTSAIGDVPMHDAPAPTGPAPGIQAAATAAAAAAATDAAAREAERQRLLQQQQLQHQQQQRALEAAAQADAARLAELNRIKEAEEQAKREEERKRQVEDDVRSGRRERSRSAERKDREREPDRAAQP